MRMMATAVMFVCAVLVGVSRRIAVASMMSMMVMVIVLMMSMPIMSMVMMSVLSVYNSRNRHK